MIPFQKTNLVVHAGVSFAFFFVRLVVALRDAVANLRGNDAANLVVALKQSRRGTSVVLAVGRFVRLVAAVVLLIALPPKRDAFVRLLADELGSRAVGQAALFVVGQVKVLGTGAGPLAIRRKQA